MTNPNFANRQETMYYNATKEFYTTRNIDVAAYLEYMLKEPAEASITENPYGPRVQFSFKNVLKIRDLLEIYDRGEAQVEPKVYTEIKIKLINKKHELIPRTVGVANQTSAQSPTL